MRPSPAGSCAHGWPAICCSAASFPGFCVLSLARRDCRSSSCARTLLRTIFTKRFSAPSSTFLPTNHMNEITPTPGPIPPTIPLSVPHSLLPLGDHPDDREPIPNPIVAIEAILRQPRRVMFQLRLPGAGRLVFSMLAVAVLCSLIYGLVIGTFSMGTQLWAAPVKVALGLLISAIICLPS